MVLKESHRFSVLRLMPGTVRAALRGPEVTKPLRGEMTAASDAIHPPLKEGRALLSIVRREGVTHVMSKQSSPPAA